MTKKLQRSGRARDQRDRDRVSPTEQTRATKKKIWRNGEQAARTRAKRYPRTLDKRLLAASEVQLRPKDVPIAQAIFLEQIERHGSPSKACITAGVGRRTFYDWLHEPDKTFWKAYGLARRVWRMSVIDDVESSFGERAQVRDTLAGIVLLKNNRKRYREVQRVEMSGPDGGPIVTLEAKEELIKRLERMQERLEQRAQTVGGVEVQSLPAGSSGSTGSAGSKGPQLGIIRAGSEGSQRGVRKVKNNS
jgi:hypothetical protein